jgi:Succinate dehydrogenase/fumarate reductase, Fe-S protein subunit
MEDVQPRIRRFNPETDEAPHWETYTVAAEPTDRVLDLLHQVKWYQDGTLTFCVDACPRGINITRAIFEMTRQIE